MMKELIILVADRGYNQNQKMINTNDFDKSYKDDLKQAREDNLLKTLLIITDLGEAPIQAP